MALGVTLMSWLWALLRVTTHSSRLEEGQKGLSAGTRERSMEDFLITCPWFALNPLSEMSVCGWVWSDCSRDLKCDL